ncbi:MAG: MFS transporter [Solirubrobacteraceae bacterium]
MRFPAHTPRLRRIAFAYSANETGRWFALLALSLAVYAHTGSSVSVAAVLVAPLLPALLAPALVARLESSRRSGTLSLLYAVQAASAAGLAVLLWHFSLPGILVVIGIDGAVSFAARGLLRSEATRSARSGGGRDDPADPRAIHRANATLNICLALTGVAGPALAGLSVEGLGGSVSLLIDAGAMVLCGALVVDLRPFVEEAGASVRARLLAAGAHMRETPGLGGLLATEALAVVFFTCAVPVELLYARHTLHAGGAGYGSLVASWGVGMIAGSVLFARAGAGRRGRGRALNAMLCGGTLAVGLAFIGLALAPSLWPACLAAAIGGLGNGTQWASLLETVQRLTPERLLGRMMGAVEGLGGVAPAIGYGFGGLLGAMLAPRAALLVAGTASTAMTAVFIVVTGASRGGPRSSPTLAATAGLATPPPAAHSTGSGQFTRRGAEPQPASPAATAAAGSQAPAMASPLSAGVAKSATWGGSGGWAPP